MASKYHKLTEFLSASEEEAIPLPFVQIESILGFPLPASARSHQAWWANQPRGQALAWLRAGFKSSYLSLDEERLTFVRAGEDQVDESSTLSAPTPLDPLSIADAKERLAVTFGVMPSQIEITIKA